MPKVRQTKKAEKKPKKEEYFTLDAILKRAPEAKYYVIFGERSNGKTFAVLEHGIDEWIKSKGQRQMAIIRRYLEDFRGGGAQSEFNGFIENEDRGNIIASKTKGEWNSIVYLQGAWYFAFSSENPEDRRRCQIPLAYSFNLAQEEHKKGPAGGYPLVTTILFDEFLTRGYYLPDEFIKFQSLISTIVRKRDNARIFMCGNTINKYCPYFYEMGLTKIKTQQKGTIDVYEYGESGLVVATQFADFPAKAKKSDVYFAFDNPKLKMITQGDWEIALYPHLPYDYSSQDVIYQYFVKFDDEILHCEIINHHAQGEPVSLITYVHRKTTPIKDESRYMVYQQEYDPRPNYSRKLTSPFNEIGKKVLWFFKADKVFYQDNSVGETMKNYLMWCQRNA